MSGLGVQSFLAVAIVLALVAGLAYLLRKGAFGALGRRGGLIAVETAVPLGERRSLVVVAVEGRRLLLGLTPGQISMVTELGPVPTSPARGDGASFEQHLAAQTTQMRST